MRQSQATLLFKHKDLFSWMNTFVLQEESRPHFPSLTAVLPGSISSSSLLVKSCTCTESFWTTGPVVSHLPKPSSLQGLLWTHDIHKIHRWVLVCIPGACICLAFHVPELLPGPAGSAHPQGWDGLNPWAKYLPCAHRSGSPGHTKELPSVACQTMALGNNLGKLWEQSHNASLQLSSLEWI